MKWFTKLEKLFPLSTSTARNVSKPKANFFGIVWSFWRCKLWFIQSISVMQSTYYWEESINLSVRESGEFLVSALTILIQFHAYITLKRGCTKISYFHGLNCLAHWYNIAPFFGLSRFFLKPEKFLDKIRANNFFRWKYLSGC